MWLCEARGAAHNRTLWRLMAFIQCYVLVVVNDTVGLDKQKVNTLSIVHTNNRVHGHTVSNANEKINSLQAIYQAIRCRLKKINSKLKHLYFNTKITQQPTTGLYLLVKSKKR